MEFRRFYRYDFAVTQVLSDLASKYYGIAVSAQILSYTPTSVVQLLNTIKKPFFIDPMTFVFGRDIESISKDGKVRKSYRQLADHYGSTFKKCISGDRLTPSDFKETAIKLDDSLINEVCTKVLDFQRERCKIKTSFPKYEKLLKKGFDLSPVSCSFLVAPYFFAETRNAEWYRISLRFAEQARRMKGGEELYPVICISRDVLWDIAEIRDIVQDYRGFDGYLIWVNDLDEEDVRSNELTGLKALVSGLAVHNRPVYSLYGGYLFDLMGKFGLTGYSSGICYGESRSVDAKGGGAGNRYYVVNAHLKISEGLANAFFAKSTRNRNLMCSCPTCDAIRRSLSSSLTSDEYADRFFNKMDFLEHRRHFVNAKSQETNQLMEMSNAQVVDLLDSDVQMISNIDRLPEHPRELTSQHLKTWRELFS